MFEKYHNMIKTVENELKLTPWSKEIMTDLPYAIYDDARKGEFSIDFRTGMIKYVIDRNPSVNRSLTISSARFNVSMKPEAIIKAYKELVGEVMPAYLAMIEAKANIKMRGNQE